MYARIPAFMSPGARRFGFFGNSAAWISAERSHRTASSGGNPIREIASFRCAGGSTAIIAARSAHLKSAVAGNADIIIAPDLEAGNMLAKQLEHLAAAISGGVVLGATVPIVLANRNDSIESRVASLVLSLLMANHLRAPR